MFSNCLLTTPAADISLIAASTPNTWQNYQTGKFDSDQRRRALND
jgi:hypothetical protein